MENLRESQISKTGNSKAYVTSDGTEMIRETLDISFSKYEPLMFREATTGEIKYGFKLFKKVWVNPQPAVSLNMI